MGEVSTVYLWSNGVVMVFGEDGEQIAEMQGLATQERLALIRSHSTPATQWHGFDEDGPCVWP